MQATTDTDRKQTTMQTTTDTFARQVQAIEAALCEGGNYAVPCSRYGTDTESCAPVAARVAVILNHETGEEGDPDYVMGLVVNDHPDPAKLLLSYGPSYGFDPDDFIDRADFS